MPQPLNNKDAASFRQVVKLYEAKQHKKALKTAEQILKKNANHGDTLAMKALTMNAQGYTSEAFELAKSALKADMKSHICWHVYGLLYRSTKQLDEAIKAYKFALKLEPDSAQIQRDLAYLQIQMRDYSGYIDSRKAMLQAKPAIRQNWTALAVAYHLSGDLEAAEKHLVAYENTLKNAPSWTDVEHSEASLYRNSLYDEMGEAEKALEHLESIFNTSLDRTAVMEARAKYQLQLGRKEDAEKSYRALVVRNNEYRPYYEGLERACGLDRSNPEHATKLAELYQLLADDNERLDAARRIPLDFLEGESFKLAVDRYLKRMLIKGVPSTFPNIKALYVHPSKLEIIQDLVESYISEPTVTNGDDKESNGRISTNFEQSRLYFLAQHYNYYRSCDLSKAMQNINKALELNPKSVDYTMTKARILKHMGNLAKASDTMNHAREMDEKDRYINTKCAKYQLRNNENENALNTMSKFTRNETVGGALGDLHDMQCMWFIAEDGEANFRQDKLSVALKRFKSIYDIFDIWQEDQFDFHHFSMRKGQIRAYVNMMRWEDRLREHPFYARAAINAIKIYLMLHDDPDLAHGQTNGLDLGALSANDRKKAIKKAKREQERLAKEVADKREVEKKAHQPKKAAGGDGETKKEDPDPQGLTLLKTETPLEDATKFLTTLLELSPKNLSAQNVGFEVYLRRKKYLLALKCLKAAHSIDPEQPELHEQLVRFRLTLEEPSHTPAERIAEVLQSCCAIIPSKDSLISFNNQYLSKHKDCASRTQSALRARQLLDPTSKALNERDLLATLELPEIKLQEAVDGLALLKEWKSESSVGIQYVSVARKRWPEATAL